jgi:transcriptional regulator with XRE-family HTH domain
MQGSDASLGARIGSAVRRIRRRRQPPLTQRELAELAMVAPGTIAFLETGRVRNPRAEITDALAGALGFRDTTDLLRADREILTSGGETEPASSEGEEPEDVPGVRLPAEDLEALKEAVQALRQGQAELWRAFFQHVAGRPGPQQIPTTPGPQAADRSLEHTPLDRQRVEDGAMEPWLYPGDSVLYDPGARPRAGDPVVAGVPAADTGVERVVVRYYFPRRRQIELRAAGGEPILLPAESVIVYGVVRERLQPVPRWEEGTRGTGDEHAGAPAQSARETDDDDARASRIKRTPRTKHQEP